MECVLSESNLPQVTIYTDGACKPNPGPGGWAAVLLYPDPPPRELVGSDPETTNNRMELRAALEALLSLAETHHVELYTDSQYLRRGITEWLPSWQERDWQTTVNTDVKNQELWEALAEQLKRHRVTWHWTKGHAGDQWNERADALARSAIPAPPLPLDDDQAIHIFTAASYLGREKVGGWGVLLRYRDRTRTLSGSVRDTTGNRMHIRAAIEGLRALKRPLPIHLYTTSGYLKDGATIWVKSWPDRDWLTKEGRSVRNRDLWEALANLTQEHEINWHVVSKRDAPPEMAQAKQLSSQAARSSIELKQASEEE
jgi:ribonuclease HI